MNRKLLNLINLDLKASKDFLEYFGKIHYFETPKDWYYIKHLDFQRIKNGESFLKYHENDLLLILRRCFPMTVWNQDIWSFSQTAPSTWRDIEQQRNFLSFVAKSLDISKYQDWYSISASQITELGGQKFLIATTLQRALLHIYPEYPWKSFEFSRTPHGTWLDVSNRRGFLDTLGKKLGIKKWEDWYNITKKTIAENGGYSILKYYGDSQFQILKDAYPEYEWKPWLFEIVPIGFWENVENVRDYFKWLGIHLDGCFS